MVATKMNQYLKDPNIIIVYIIYKKSSIAMEQIYIYIVMTLKLKSMLYIVMHICASDKVT